MAKRKSDKPKKPGKKVRMEFRRNRSQPARDKSWTRQFHEHRFEELDPVQSESVVAKGALSRKRTVILAEPTDEQDRPTEGQRRRGVVLCVQGPIVEVEQDGQIWSCTVRRVLRTRLIEERSPITVGDRVQFRAVAHQTGPELQGVIEDVEPRRSCLSRMSDRRIHTIAANVDQAILVASADVPPLKPHLIDRYIVAAHAGSIRPVVCINKMDLDHDGAARRTLELYASLGYTALATSVPEGMGIEQLKEILKDQCSVFVGQSGVGKSSLLNAVEPSLNLPIGQVSEATLKGRHTTRTARLIKLTLPGYVVDTAGIRTFDVETVPRGELEAYFVEFVDRVAECKYPNCTHIHEDGCAIRAAVQAGHIHPQRYESYVRMFTGA